MSAPVVPRLARSRRKIDLVAIGASTGGPNTLATTFSRFPANLPVPIVVVQHMPPVFTRHLADRLSRESNLPVVEAEDGMVLEAGHAYIAPGDRHMVLARASAGGRIVLNEDPPVNSCRPSVDVLFHSIEELFGGRVLTVVLTGMGEDGLAGVRALREKDAPVLIQDEASSVVWGMAGAVARAGLADAALPADELGNEIVRRAWYGRTLA